MYAVKDALRAELDQIEADGLTKNERLITTPQSSHISTTAGDALNFCANNYLGLADHPDIVAAARDAVAGDLDAKALAGQPDGEGADHERDRDEARGEVALHLSNTRATRSPQARSTTVLPVRSPTRSAVVRPRNRSPASGRPGGASASGA